MFASICRMPLPVRNTNLTQNISAVAVLVFVCFCHSGTNEREKKGRLKSKNYYNIIANMLLRAYNFMSK